MICEMKNSTVRVSIELIGGTKVVTAKTWDVLPARARLFTHAVLNTVYLVYQGIEHEYGSILNLKREKIVQRLIDAGLATDTAQRCMSFLDEVDWAASSFPLRDWIRRIRSFYYDKP
jgi:hypothetical protein